MLDSVLVKAALNLVIGTASLREDTITELKTLKRGWLVQELKMVPDLAPVHFGNSKAKKRWFYWKEPHITELR